VANSTAESRSGVADPQVADVVEVDASLRYFNHGMPKFAPGVHALAQREVTGLDARVEAHAFRPVLFMSRRSSASSRRSCGTRAVPGSGVDADHAAVHFVGEVARDVSVAREDRDAIAVS